MFYHLGLTGYPLGHSLSPQIHAAALTACGLTGDYSLFPVSPAEPAALAALLNRLRAGEIHGLNVTIPHKQNLIPLLDDLTETARAIGAVNTISAQNGRLIGDNTDAAGFLSDLKNFLAPSNSENRELALVIGAGGAARAIVYALVNAGWQVTIAARRPEQAESLRASLQAARSQIESMPLNAIRIWRGDLLVNTTPLGMTPAIETSPWPETIALPAGAAIYDLVYNPRETRLVRTARAAGLPATTGLGMLIEQAALAFEIWTGFQVPRALLWQAVEP